MIEFLYCIGNVWKDPHALYNTMRDLVNTQGIYILFSNILYIC